MALSSNNLSPMRPYLLRAFYSWMLDNKLTPHISVDATVPGSTIPFEYAQGGYIILNISPMAVRFLKISNRELSCHARFGGVPYNIVIPIRAVMIIYPKEDPKLGITLPPERCYSTDEDKDYDFDDKYEYDMNQMSSDLSYRDDAPLLSVVDNNVPKDSKVERNYKESATENEQERVKPKFSVVSDKEVSFEQKHDINSFTSFKLEVVSDSKKDSSKVAKPMDEKEEKDDKSDSDDRTPQ